MAVTGITLDSDAVGEVDGVPVMVVTSKAVAVEAGAVSEATMPLVVVVAIAEVGAALVAMTAVSAMDKKADSEAVAAVGMVADVAKVTSEMMEVSVEAVAEEMADSVAEADPGKMKEALEVRLLLITFSDIFSEAFDPH